MCCNGTIHDVFSHACWRCDGSYDSRGAPIDHCDLKSFLNRQSTPQNGRCQSYCVRRASQICRSTRAVHGNGISWDGNESWCATWVKLVTLGSTGQISLSVCIVRQTHTICQLDTLCCCDPILTKVCHISDACVLESRCRARICDEHSERCWFYYVGKIYERHSHLYGVARGGIYFSHVTAEKFDVVRWTRHYAQKGRDVYWWVIWVDHILAGSAIKACWSICSLSIRVDHWHSLGQTCKHVRSHITHRVGIQNSRVARIFHELDVKASWDVTFTV